MATQSTTPTVLCDRRTTDCLQCTSRLTSNISERFADAAIETVSLRSEAPFFVHVNFTAPHDPLLVPKGYENAYDPGQIPLPRNFMPEHPFETGNIGRRDEVLLPTPRTEKDVREDIAVYYMN